MCIFEIQWESRLFFSLFVYFVTTSKPFVRRSVHLVLVCLEKLHSGDESVLGGTKGGISFDSFALPLCASP